MRTLFVFILLLLNFSLACTVSKDYSNFEAEESGNVSDSFTLEIIGYEDEAGEVAELSKPSFFLERVIRGFSSEPFTSCSDLGFMHFKSYERTSDATAQFTGFKFERVSGDHIEDLFPDYWIQLVPNAENLLEVRFIWVDRYSASKIPFDFVVSVKATNRLGETSEPQYIRVFDYGVKH